MKYSICLLNKAKKFSMLSTGPPKMFATQIPSLQMIKNFASALPNEDLIVLQVQGYKCTWAASSEQCCTGTCTQILHHPAFPSSLRTNMSLVINTDKTETVINLITLKKHLHGTKSRLRQPITASVTLFMVIPWPPLSLSSRWYSCSGSFSCFSTSLHFMLWWNNRNQSLRYNQQLQR